MLGVREMHLHVLASPSFVFFIPLVAGALASPPVRSMIAGRVTTLPPSLANFLSFYCERRRWMGMDGGGRDDGRMGGKGRGIAIKANSTANGTPSNASRRVIR